jgi:hypothetical protein
VTSRIETKDLSQHGHIAHKVRIDFIDDIIDSHLRKMVVR